MRAEEIRPERIQRIGRWPVRRYIGSGGFSWVFEVEDERLKVRRALKLLKPDAAQGDGYRRFWREAEILASIDDPHLVRIYELDRDPATGLDYFVMELLTGHDLAKLLEEEAAAKRRLPLPRVVHVFLGALQGLSRLHALRTPIVHRDIKPANIQITDEGVAKLLDLGIAHVSYARDETMKESVLTKNVGFIGTVRYASPEQLRVGELGPPSDVFSVGLCLFEILEGRHPYAGIRGLSTRTYQELLRYYERLELARGELSLHFHRTPKSLRPVLRRALATRPEIRYRDAGEMREALRRAAEGRPVDLQGPRGTRGWRARIGATAALLLVVSGAALWWFAATQCDQGLSAKLAQTKLDAERAREAAWGAGAERSAQAEWAGAENAIARAREAEQEGEVDAAGRQYARARDNYHAARDAAVRAIAEVTDSQARARKAQQSLPEGGDCQALAGPEPQALCLQGAELLSRGGEALAVLDAPRARASFAEAEAVLARIPPLLGDPFVAEFEALLQAYEIAIESKDLEKLRAIWDMTSFDRDLWHALFLKHEQLLVKLKLLDHTLDASGKTASILFTLTIADPKVGAPMVDGPVRAMLRRSPEGWRIVREGLLTYPPPRGDS